MIDPRTLKRLTELRRRIDAAHDACGATLKGMQPESGPTPVEATPFLAACAEELEALAGKCRLAAARADRKVS